MPETARMLGEAISQKQLNKTIVLTGAMLPYELKNSDAVFNLGFAIGVAQTLENGVYIAMNGQIFAWDNVMKNRAVGIFSDLPTEK